MRLYKQVPVWKVLTLESALHCQKKECTRCKSYLLLFGSFFVSLLAPMYLDVFLYYVECRA